ncbi:hypothetical protein SADUNF_Sadunf02G0014100 [Salix dunnii]|uniref:Uncharacterized protein n=1 Tax=Salix dunnii TaxID=1413687 RepID=A0A835N5H1_9ROSI|nr:hypothetical protein SADUNF_Sadunf02G0014100 [Salix dunnii]
MIGRRRPQQFNPTIRSTRLSAFHYEILPSRVCFTLYRRGSGVGPLQSMMPPALYMIEKGDFDPEDGATTYQQMMKIVYKFPLSCAAASSAATSFAFLVSSTVSAIACKLFCAILASEFALVGTILGAYCGALVGLNSKSSFLHGAKVGAIMGCVLSIEFFRKAFVLWDSDDWAIGIFIHLVQILNERIKRLSAHSTVCSNGKSMLKITDKRHTGKNIADSLRNEPTCSICLQVFGFSDEKTSPV